MTPFSPFDALLPRGRFRTIVIDPPWPYGTRSPFGRTEKTDGTRARGVGQTRYSFIPMDELRLMPVRQRVSDNAHCYLWTTNGFMDEAYDLMRAWGFEPKTIVTWGKVKADGTPSMKTGHYFRGASEHILFGVRGKRPVPKSKGYPTLRLSPRLPHSVKPQWFYEMVDALSPGPTLELFARRQWKDWTCWGAQVTDSHERKRA